MKNLVEIVKGISMPVTAIAVLIAIVFLSQECGEDKPRLSEGKVLVDQSFLDSLNWILAQPPDTIPGDTIRIKGDIVYVPKRIPVPYTVDAETNLYTDSIVNDSIDVRIELMVKGIISKWNWSYRPVIHRFETIVERTIPKPMPYEVPVSKAGLYGSFGVGGNQSAFILSGNLDYINKKDNLYGFQYLRFNQESFYLFKIGKKIKFKR